MALPAINPTTTNAWKLLQQHFNDVQHTEIKSLFAEILSGQLRLQSYGMTL